MPQDKRTLKKIDEIEGIMAVTSYVLYAFLKLPVLGLMSTLLFLWWLSFDMYVSYTTRSYPSLVIDLVFIAFLAYALINPSSLTTNSLIMPFYAIVRLPVLLA